MDEHFKNMPYQDNLPVLLGLLSLWNVSFLGHGAKAILPYCQVRRGSLTCCRALMAGGLEINQTPSLHALCETSWVRCPSFKCGQCEPLAECAG
jgi:hypothetical protein